MSDVPSWLQQLIDGSLEGLTEAEVGKIKLTSGRIVACDPLVFLRGADAFAREVPAGSFPIRLGRMDGGDNAFAMIRFSKAKPVSWEVARCPGEEDVEGWPGYGVDSGIACFVDAAAVRAFMEREDALGERVAAKIVASGVDPNDPLAYHEAYHEHRESEGPDPIADLEVALRKLPVATAVLDDQGSTLVAFRAGAGDGVYASFWGLNAKGAVVCLVSDFGLLEPPSDDDDDDGFDDDEEDFSGDDDSFDDGETFDDEDFVKSAAGAGLSGLEALAAALSAREEPEPTQGPSPLFLQTRDLLKRWVKEEKLELEPDTNVDAFAEALLEKLVSIAGHRYPGKHVGEWLLDRPEVADVFASDDEIEADLTPK